MDKIREQAIIILKEHGLENDLDTSYITEDLILGYLEEAEEVDEATFAEYGSKEAAPESTPLHPSDLYVVYGHSLLPVGQTLYFLLVNNTTNVCTNLKRKMRSPTYNQVGSCNTGKPKYRIYGWYPPVPAKTH